METSLIQSWMLQKAFDASLCKKASASCFDSTSVPFTKFTKVREKSQFCQTNSYRAHLLDMKLQICCSQIDLLLIEDLQIVIDPLLKGEPSLSRHQLVLAPCFRLPHLRQLLDREGVHTRRPAQSSQLSNVYMSFTSLISLHGSQQVFICFFKFQYLFCTTANCFHRGYKRTGSSRTGDSQSNSSVLQLTPECVHIFQSQELKISSVKCDSIPLLHIKCCNEDHFAMHGTSKWMPAERLSF